jgi:hypothetical protein
MPNKAKKTKRTIIMYAGFAAVLIALVLFIVLRRQDRMQYGLPETPVISAREIDGISIRFGDGGSVDLRRGDPAWMIAPNGYPVDSSAVADMLESLADFAITDLVSTSGYFDRYELDDENKIVVTATGDGKELLTFDLGKRAPSYNHSYVALGDGQVYHAATDLRRVFDKDTNSLRDRMVLAFAKDEIVEITASLPGMELNLTKSSATVGTGDSAITGAASWRAQDGEEWPTESIDEFLDRLDDLSCSEYADESRSGDIAPLLSLNLQGREGYRFTLLAEDETGFLASSSQTPYEFYISAWQGNNILDTFKPEETDGS